FKGRNYHTGIYLHHLSQDGQIANQKHARSGLELTGTLIKPTKIWTADFEFLRQRFHRYGYNHDSLEYESADVRHTYFGYNLGLGMTNTGGDAQDLRYGISALGSNWQKVEGSGAHENTIHSKGFIAKRLDDDFDLRVGVDWNITKFSQPNGGSNNVLQLQPSVTYTPNDFSFKLGLYPTWGRAGNAYILPDVQLDYRPEDNNFRMGIGATSALLTNSFRTLSQYNPFINDTFQIRQSRVDQYYLRLGTNLSSNLHLHGEVAYKHFNNMVYFQNDSTEIETFQVKYTDPVNALGIKLGASFQFGERFVLDAES